MGLSARTSIPAILPILVLGLAGCDEGPAVRQNLAQCELEPRAHNTAGGFDNSFLLTCMQARGFILDFNQAAACKAVPYPAIQATCYRSDDWLHSFVLSK